MKFSAFRMCALVGLTGLALVGFYSHAQPTARAKNAPPVAVANNKVIIYQTANENLDQLKANGITRVTNYGSYWLVEATDAQVDQLTQMYGPRAVKESRFNSIQLNGVTVDTTPGEPAVPAELREKEGTGKRLRLVQFRGPILPEWLQLLPASGAEVISYIPNNAYLVRLDQPAEGKLLSMVQPGSPIQWIGAYYANYKIQNGLLEAGAQDNESLVDVRILMARDSKVEGAPHPIQEFGLVQDSHDLAREKVVSMTVPVSVISQIAQLPDVFWIEKAEPKRLLDEVQDLVLADQTNAPGFGPTNTLVGTSATFTNYLDFLFKQVAGTNTSLASLTSLIPFIDPNTYPIVDISDTGLDDGGLGVSLDMAHPCFYFLGEPIPGYSRVVYLGPPWIAGDPNPQLNCETRINEHLTGFRFIEAADLSPDSHGTMVASILAGFDTNKNVLGQVCLELVTTTNTVVVNLSQGLIDACGNFVAFCPQIGTTNYSICFDTGVTDTCFTAHTHTNVTITLTAGTCPCANSCPTPFTTNFDVAYTQVVPTPFDDIRTDASGFQLGMGVSPFGLIGANRIMTQDFTSFDSTGGGCTYLYAAIDHCIYATDGGTPNNLPALMAIAYEDFARIQNNSWADIIDIQGLNGGRYTVDSQSYDIGVRDALLVGASNNVPGPSPLNQEFIVVFACNSLLGDAGNEGPNGGFADIRVTAPATAKNVISVGASVNPRLLSGLGGACWNQTNSLEMALFSAAGPTLDGRFKPEIVAPGSSVYGARSQIAATTTNCSQDSMFPTFPYISVCTNPPCTGAELFYDNLYRCDSGSSFAAPAVSGAIQLLWWYFQHRLTNEVGQALFQPSPAMAKAYVCNAARYLPVTDPRSGAMDTLPSILQGMGELDLKCMFDGVGRAIRDESTPRAINVPLITTNPAPQQTYFSKSGQSYELTGKIASGGFPFRVTVAWTDVAGAPLATAQELVNDLDLEVTLGGVTYKGNVFAQNVSVPGGGFDSVNNMESVFLNPVGWLGGISAVTAGAPWQVIVRASNIAGQGVPNVGEPVLGGSNTLNQDFALVVYNAATNTLSDVPNLGLHTNNSCSTAINLTQFPYTFTNTLTNSVYSNVQPSPSAATGGDDEFFKIPLPTAGTTFEIDTDGSDFDTVLSVWSVQVIPETVLVRGECGYLTEVVSENDASGSGRSLVSFTADGTNDYYIVVEGRNGAMGHLVLNVNRQCTVSLFPSSLPSSRLGVLYTAQVAASGGALPFTFAVSPTNGLPPGLTLSKTSGVISGVPTATGSYAFTITATDALGCSGSGTYTISIACPSLTLSPPTLPAALDGQAYSNVISAIGGQNPITFTLAVGPLPTGLTLSPSGLLSGIPNVLEAPSTNRLFSFKVQAVDTNGCSGSQFYTISVNCPNIAITNSQNSFPVGTEFKPYPGVQLGATGGTVTVTSPYVFSQTGGSLPAGMGLTSGGMITGTPTSVSSSFTVTVTDNNGCKGSKTYTLPLSDPVPPANTTTTVLNVGPPSLPAGVVGQNYISTFGASGGNGSYSFAVPPGFLPPGLSLSSAGALTGMPTTPGTFSFTVTATDTSSDSGSMSYTVTVTSEADLAVSAAALDPQTVVIGSNLTCSITVTNLGPAPATGVTVSSLLPSGVSFVPSSTGCTADGSTVVCSIGSLAAGAGAEISYVVTPSVTGTVSFTASVAGDQTDVNLANNMVAFNGAVKAPYTVATNPKAITDVDGDIVSVTLKGKGAMEVRVLGGDNRGPIDQVVLTGTTASSTLAIQVKKPRGGQGDGLVNIGSIIATNGGLKAITGMKVSLTGAGIQVAGSLGSLTVNALSDTTVSVGGTLGTVQLQSMSGSACTVTGAIKSIAAKSYSASTISAAKVLGSVKLGTVTGGAANRITVQQSGGTVSVANPRTKPWKITASTQQGGVQVIVGP